MSKLTAFCLFLTSLMLLPVSARAEKPAFETSTVIAVGGPVGLLFLDTMQKTTTQPSVGYFAQRVRFPRYSMVGVEANVFLPSGAGASLLLEVIQTDSFRLHLAPGVHGNVGQPVSGQRFARSWDLTLGVGAEIALRDGLNLTVDYRAFVPDPFMMSQKLGYFARPFWDEALKGGQLCLGLSFTL